VNFSFRRKAHKGNSIPLLRKKIGEGKELSALMKENPSQFPRFLLADKDETKVNRNQQPRSPPSSAGEEA